MRRRQLDKAGATTKFMGPAPAHEARGLSGAYTASAGAIYSQGQGGQIRAPRDSKALGIETIYQHLALADNLDVPANVFLGRKLRNLVHVLDDRAMEAETHRMLDRFKVKIDSLRDVLAVGRNEEAVRLCGVNTRLVKVLAYTIAGALTGIGAVVLSSRVISGYPNLGLLTQEARRQDDHL